MTMAEAHVFAHEVVAGRYRLLEVFSRETGRLGWYAEDLVTGQPRVVARTVLPESAGEDTGRRLTARVLHAGETMRLLRPDRVAAVVDAVVEGGALWTVTEWIDGTPLGELLARAGSLDPARAARLGLDLLDVLQAAHDEGLVHGELSPGQVFVRGDGPAVVTGFGTAGATPAPRLAAPSYAAPEQARDERIGPAADLWALGALLYTAVEGRPPFRDRGPAEATLRAVDRLPPRTPLRAGPLTQAVRGLLRKDPRDRPPRPALREALTRALREPTDTTGRPPSHSRPHDGRVPPRSLRHLPLGLHRLRSNLGRLTRGLPWLPPHSLARVPRGRRVLVAGAALAVAVAVVIGVVPAATGALSGTRPAAAPPRAVVPATPSDGRTSGPPPPASPSPALPAAPASPSPAPPAGYRPYRAPEGFSVALPDGWRRLATSRVGGLAYRVTFGRGGGTPTLAVTYSERVGPDPVAVWRRDVEPGLAGLPGYRRIGAVRATTCQGRRAADLQWLAGSGRARTRTFGRGLLLGGGRGFSLRFTAPAASWDDAVNQVALTTFLRTFRVPRE
ncbi:serine/threonine-protein kinase [Streptomyces achromogenes]|uniref:serine/threonine-protein kinase n=1 Tax=Streptomyces achromogenes TaxID=67255 RepID=UPI00369E8912